MITMGCMILGIVAGQFFPSGQKSKNIFFQLCITLLLIFLMGVNLGQRPGFFSELALLGIHSFFFFLFPTLFSVGAVFLLTRYFMNGVPKKSDFSDKTQERKRPGEKDPMVFLALTALILGIFCGAVPPIAGGLRFLSSHTQWFLYVLMFSVGISVGLQKGVFRGIRQYHLKILMIPFGIIAGSMAGGALCGILLPYTMSQSLSVAGGLGWYSLAGVTIGNLAGTSLGSIAFLSNLMREIGSFFMIPFVSRHFNFYTCIAPAGATSEDTTLPMIIRYTNEETVIFSVLNGIICSFCVPFLIAVCYS